MARILPTGPTLMMPKAPARPTRKKVDVSEKHLAFIRSLPCVASGVTVGSVPHHIRIGRFMMSKKVPDYMTVPLHPIMHVGEPQALHSCGCEGKWWNAFGIDPFALAAVLWEISGDQRRGVAEVMAARAAGDTRRRYGIKIFDEKEAA